MSQPKKDYFGPIAITVVGGIIVAACTIYMERGDKRDSDLNAIVQANQITLAVHGQQLIDYGQRITKAERKIGTFSGLSGQHTNITQYNPYE